MTTSIHTRIMDILDAAGASYRLLPHSEPAYTVEVAARTRGVVAEEMVKSILVRDRDGRFVMACVPGPARVNPQAVRACLPTEWKRLFFASATEILAVTGCEQGAVAPLGLPPAVPVILDEALVRCPRVSISSGDLMLGLELDPAVLLRLSGARLARITLPPTTETPA